MRQATVIPMHRNREQRRRVLTESYRFDTATGELRQTWPARPARAALAAAA